MLKFTMSLKNVPAWQNGHRPHWHDHWYDYWNNYCTPARPFLCILLVVLFSLSVLVSASSCSPTPANSYTSSRGAAFDGTNLHNPPLEEFSEIYPDMRIPLRRNTRLSNMLHIGRHAFYRQGYDASCITNTARTLIVTNYLTVHDLGTVPRSNIVQPIDTIPMTNTPVPMNDNLSYTTFLKARQDGEQLIFRHSSFSKAWARTAKKLDRMLHRFMKENYGRLPTLRVKDLKTGNTMSFNHRIKVFGASILKNYVMAAVFEDLQNIDREIMTLKQQKKRLLQQKQKEKDADQKKLKKLLEKLLEKRKLHEILVYPMITKSENGPYAYFRKHLGDNFFTRFLESINIHLTRMTPDDRSTTAADLAFLYEQFYYGNLFHDPYLKWKSLRLLRLTGRVGLGYYLPSHIKVAQKRGVHWHFNYQSRHNIGIVYFRDHPLIISLVGCGPPLDMHFQFGLTELAARIARLFYLECYLPLYREEKATARGKTNSG